MTGAKTTSAPDRDWGPKGRVQSAVTLTAAKAVDVDGTLIGDVTDLIVDIITGRIAMSSSRWARCWASVAIASVPWPALAHDAEAACSGCVEVSKSVLTEALLVERGSGPR